ncbi:hypothetical protein QN277_005653 [Acacia crassicarpa]|uniref:Uncharacterized protein n=1 Tax=Acacia crassicarpa TaxID=499986 RepID=A0AAE1JU09_9FABA|nr:hypothetical protein QN277_005653 [Acacia crassicarpa]
MDSFLCLSGFFLFDSPKGFPKG